MNTFKLNSFKKGWFIGDFTPTLFNTDNFEVAIKKYQAGESEKLHYHKVADEITVIVSGKVKMNDMTYNEDDIIFIAKGDSTDFHAITDTITCVVKVPCVKNDKYE